jgi:S-adenosylmethionine:tRNA ribosyltransferase-isomerase
MNAATQPRSLRESARMLVLDRVTGDTTDSSVTRLPDALRPGDLLVVNDAATLPASLAARGPSSEPFEIRLSHHIGGSDWRAILMGAGTWKTPTELRDPPGTVRAGDTLEISNTFAALVVEVSAESPQLVTLRLSRQGMQMWAGIYAHGRPIQYSHVSHDLPLWSFQTPYASRPWAAEMPSAGYPLAWCILLEMRKRGIRIAWLTHAAGLSASGDEDLDRRLPFKERFEIPESTIDAIRNTRRFGGRVIAIGTTVVRALEGCFASHGALVQGKGETELVVDRFFQLRVADGILTGMHDPAHSHFHLLRAFAPEGALRKAWRYALEAGYLTHEFGDVCLIL